MAAAVDWTVCEEIVVSELRRFKGTLPGYDAEDLAQECRIAIARASERVDPLRRGAKSYLRTAARNQLSTLLAQQRTLGRCPHDAYGRPMVRAFALLNEMWQQDDGPSSEVIVQNREAVTYLREHLDPRDWDALVATFVEGARIATGRNDGRHSFSLVRARAAAILRRIGYRVSREQEDETMSAATIPQTKPEDLPECHASGEAPIGYDVEDYDCVQCRDKFSCLPGAIEKKLQPIDMMADLEVAAVHGGHMTYDVALQRMLRRHHKQKANEDLDPEEEHNFVGLLPDDDSDEPELEESDSGDDAAPPPEKPAAPPKDKPAVAAKPKKPAAKPKKPKKKVAKKPAVKKPVPKPPAAAALLLTVEARGPQKFLASVDGTRKGRIEQTEDGWGWWTRHEESPEWLPSFSKALNGIAAELKVQFPKLKTDKAARSAHKLALEEHAEAQAGKPERGASRRAPEDWPRMRDDRPYPSPRHLSKEEMAAKLADAQARLGANIELEYGMQLVRRTRKGEVVARITESGFEYLIPHEVLVRQAGLDSPVQTFGSLSAVAMWFEGRLRTGNDFFNIAKHSCTEIRSADHRIIDRKGGAPGAR